MSFWDFIKSKLFGKKEALPEAQIEPKATTPYATNQGIAGNGLDSIKVNYTPQPQKTNYMPEPNTIESALQQYLYAMMKQYNDGRTFDSYSILTSLCGMDTSNQGNNLQNEANFINRVMRDKRVNVRNQPQGKEYINFRHIQNQRDGSNTDRRLYINCKRENIAELAGKFYEEFGDDPYYFKFCTDEQASSKRRSEQFVFYVSSEPKEMNRVIQTIQRTRQKYPQLFEGSKNMNPFMRNVDGYIGYAPDVKAVPNPPEGIKNKACYEKMNGEKEWIDPSYNTLLSNALTDSFTYAMRDVVAQDYDLTSKTGGQVYERAYPYVRDTLEDVLKNPEYQRKLIEKMKANLEKCTQKNPLLSIKGLEQEMTR